MKRFTHFKKIAKRLACISLACLLILGFALENACPVSAGIVIDEEHQGYQWRRVRSQKELEEAISWANDGVAFKDMDRSYTSDTYWSRVMLIWDVGKDYYFTSGGAGSDSDYWYGKKVLSGYGIDPTADTFVTRTGLETPYIKECVGGQDSRYEKEHAYCFRLCNSAKETMSQFCASCELNFWGVSYHAASKACFTLYSKLNDKNCRPWKEHGACNADRLATVNLRFVPTWQDYFNNYGITEKQKNALLFAYSYTYWFQKQNHNVWVDTFDGHYEMHEIYDVLSDKTVRVGESTYYFSPKTGKSNIRSDAQQVQYALEQCTDTSLYDTSIFTKTYITKEYPKGISGVEAYTNLFKPLLEAYNKREKEHKLGTAFCYYDFNGNICQRYWRNDGNALDIANISYDESTDFLVYIGRPYNTPSINTDQPLGKGIVHLSNSAQIDNGVTVTVGEGTTLIVDGHIYNNGMIKVDGGTLIVAGVIDTDPTVKPGANGAVATNNINITNGGTCIINDTGAIIGRDDNSWFNVTENSSVQVDGIIITAVLSIGGRSTVRGGRLSAICVGAKAKPILSVSKYNSELLYREKEHAIGSLIDNCDEAKSLMGLTGMASFTSDGLVYTHGSFMILDSELAESAISIWRETDLKRTFKDGMRCWW